MQEEYDVIVIGAGQAGLAMGYYLSRTNISYIILDQHGRIGDSWRERYDSLVLFTPKSYSSLPGIKLEGNPEDYPTKDEIASYLEQYARELSLPILLNTKVDELSQTKTGFHLITNYGYFKARNVIIATGSFQKPYIPPLHKDVSKDVLQIHSSEYKNPEQIKGNRILVVGGGNSGVQIAVELAERFEVKLSVSKPMRMLPQSIFKKSIFWWLDTLKLSNATVKSPIGRFMRANDPIIGREIKPYLKNNKIILSKRVVGVNGNVVQFADGKMDQVDTIIWATGFKDNFSWIHIPNLFDEKQQIPHQRGITNVDGVYLLGRSWQYKRSSALVYGVGEDAQFLIQHLLGKFEQTTNLSYS